LGRLSIIAVMQTPDHRTLPDRSDLRTPHRTRHRAALRQREMRAALDVILDVASQNPAQMPLAEHIDVIEALPSDRPDQSL
jgi:hypothetical protein